MLKRIYIETTIPSFYYEVRKEPEMVSRKNWTRQWWDNHSRHYDLVTSEAVINELQQGTYRNQKQALKLLEEIPILRIDEDIKNTVQAYIKHKVMPAKPFGDAIHLALASYHKCDFLLTWNCNHLANANKFFHIRQINTMLGLFIPSMVTPLELLGG
jgi:predicted nucleic acid-binding protein